MNRMRTEVPGLLIRVLDCLDDALVLIDGAGRILHENRALNRVLPGGAEAERVRRRIRAFALAAIPLCGGSTEPGASDADRCDVLVVRGSRFRLRARYLGAGPAAGASCTLVCLQRLETHEAGAVEDLARRFGLTSQEVRVATLLARRRSNGEIARELGVSPHTARHHTESILSKLGVHSRIQVAAVVGALVAADAGSTTGE
jgi:DNA-binding CsgD family transcriptional regulator